jgi:myotubularin-related protein 1/2
VGLGGRGSGSGSGSSATSSLDVEEEEDDDDEQIKADSSTYQLYIPLMMIYRMKKYDRILEVSCKDFRTVHFSFSHSNISVSSFTERIKILFPMVDGDVFAFRHSPENQRYRNAQDGSEPGWQVYNHIAECKRLGVGDQHPNWRITHVNQSYELCDSYPHTFAVPVLCTDAELMKIKEFRSRGRIPLLSWLHPHNHASITRCSQPRVGIRGARCKEDESLMRKILAANDVNAQPILYLMDARPKANAVANQALGAGFEDTHRYGLVGSDWFYNNNDNNNDNIQH